MAREPNLRDGTTSTISLDRHGVTHARTASTTAILLRALNHPDIARYFDRVIEFTPGVCEVLWYDLAEVLVQEVRRLPSREVPLELRGLVEGRAEGARARARRMLRVEASADRRRAGLVIVVSRKLAEELRDLVVCQNSADRNPKRIRTFVSLAMRHRSVVFLLCRASDWMNSLLCRAYSRSLRSPASPRTVHRIAMPSGAMDGTDGDAGAGLATRIPPS